MLIPSHARRIKAYSDTTPLFHRYQVENQIDAFHSSTVHLKSGGYIVINPTEALVAIDVNSGRATRERSIEETATKTNLEAAEEIARQLRLRDLAGLIVIDFIDMENSRNLRSVERCVKEAMKGDRARIQLGRISHFGLMEMSRQRLRSSLLEASSRVCPHCDGSGQIRSTVSTALHVLRAIEEEGILARSDEITIHVPGIVALYILNQKRTALIEIEKRYGFSVILESDDSLIPPDYRLERTRQRAEAPEESAEGDSEKPGRKRRRRRSRSQRGDEAESQTAIDAVGGQEAEITDAVAADAGGDEDRAGQPREARDDEGEADGARKRRRRGKRGGRRRRRASSEQPAAETPSDETPSDETPSDEAPSDETVTEAQGDQSPPEAQPDIPDNAEIAAAEPEAAPAKPRRARRKSAKDKTEAGGAADDKKAKPKRARRSRRKTAVNEPAVPAETAPTDGGNCYPLTAKPVNTAARANQSAVPDPVAETAPAEAEAPKAPVPDPVAETAPVETEAPKAPVRKGWWSRLTS